MKDTCDNVLFELLPEDSFNCWYPVHVYTTQHEWIPETPVGRKFFTNERKRLS